MMAKIALRDLGATMAHKEQSLNIKITRQDQTDMLNSLRRESLSRIKAVAAAIGTSKADRFDRIDEILRDHSHDVKRILSTATVD